MAIPGPFSAAMPPAMVHPGARSNKWQGASAVHPSPSRGVTLAHLIRVLAWGETFHTNPTTGQVTSIRKRGTPSAGACYPVQWHLVCGEGFDLPAACYSFNPDEGSFMLRARSAHPILPRGRARILLTVLPRRTAARYHYRSAPVIIGDTAYALALLQAGLQGLGLKARILAGDARQLAHYAFLPEPQAWEQLWPHSAVEIPMTAVECSTQEASTEAWSTDVPESALPHEPPIYGQPQALPEFLPAPDFVPGLPELSVNQPVRLPQLPLASLSLTQLQGRACPAPEALTSTPPRKRESLSLDTDGQALGPWCSNQHWIDQAENVRLYRADPSPAAQWKAHYLAASDLVNLLAQGINCRPVSGWVHGSTHGNISHALVEEAT